MRYLVVIFAFIFSIGVLQSRDDEESTSQKPFYFDAVVFRSDKQAGGRLDFYAMIPVQNLQFLKSGSTYFSNYQLILTINDTTGRKVAGELFSGGSNFNDYFSAQGGRGDFTLHQKSFNLPPGKFKVRIQLFDSISKKTYERSRTLTIIDFDSYPFSLSGIMLLSSIEEKDGRFIITPHISDNIESLRDGFFIFFESYNRSNADSADFIYQLINDKDKVIFTSRRIRQAVRGETTRHYLKVERPEALTDGSYTIQLIALKPGAGEEIIHEDYLAVAQRSIKYTTLYGSGNIGNLDQAIKQLRYVASQEDIDFIQEGQKEPEKLKRFEAFWRKLDPTPNTERNEAFDEYYRRIGFANANYKSYNEGWLTDKGMVYIVYGQPANVERGNAGYGDNRIIERWTYRNNSEFIFLDNTGFGDFRLVRPMTVTDKYRYQR